MFHISPLHPDIAPLCIAIMRSNHLWPLEESGKVAARTSLEKSKLDATLGDLIRSQVSAVEKKMQIIRIESREKSVGPKWTLRNYVYIEIAQSRVKCPEWNARTVRKFRSPKDSRGYQLIHVHSNETIPGRITSENNISHAVCVSRGSIHLRKARRTPNPTYFFPNFFLFPSLFFWGRSPLSTKLSLD